MTTLEQAKKLKAKFGFLILRLWMLNIMYKIVFKSKTNHKTDIQKDPMAISGEPFRTQSMGKPNWGKIVSCCGANSAAAE